MSYNMKHFTFIPTWVIAMLLFPACLWAEAVSPEQAKQVASQFLTSKFNRTPGNVRRTAPAPNQLETAVVFNAVNPTGHPYLYAVNFSGQGGYVLVSGDDRFATVLGYSDANNFDALNMPENMRSFLQGYIDEMRYLDSIHYQPVLRRTTASKTAIQPLISTMWNQRNPYNDQCPWDANNMRSVTGCVATAMAQVVNYHIQHYDAPSALVAGTEAYTTESHQLSVSAVPAGSLLPDKNLLLDTYDDNATDAQKEAVATLMFYCGASVQMNYTATSSGAYSANIAPALKEIFGFDATTRMTYRTQYTYAGWMDLIYNELAESRPIIYRGASSGAGHAFVVDGHDGNDLFHINWGWGGSCNDYFALSVLNPNDDGQIGARTSSEGYNANQAAVIGIQINSGQTMVEPVCLSTIDYSVSDTTTVSFTVRNYTGATHNFTYGIGFIDESGDITPIGSTKKVTALQVCYGYSTCSFVVPANIAYANTIRKVVPISKETGTDTWYPGADPEDFYFSVSYDANGNPSISVYPNVNLQVNSLTVPSSKYITEEQTVKLSLTNSGDEFYGTLYLFASTDPDNKGDAVSQLGLTALPGITYSLYFDWNPDTIGTYNLWVARDADGIDVLDSTTVIIKEDASLDGKLLAIMSVSFEGQDRDSYRVDDETGIREVDVYNGDTLKGSISVKNLTSSGIIAYRYRILLDEYNEETGLYTNGTSNTYYTLTFTLGQTRNLTINKCYEANKTYRIRLIVLNNDNPNQTHDLDARYVVHMHSVSPPQAIVTAPVANTLTYNGAEQALVSGGSAAGGELQYSLDSITWSTTIPAATDAGVYKVYYKAVGDAGHSDSEVASVTITLAAAPLTVTADDITITYGVTAPVYTVSYSGWQGDDNTSVLSGTLSVTCPYTAGDNVGTYTITPGGVTASNYNITFYNGTLTVNKAAPLLIVAPTAIDGLEYTGHALTLINAGNADGGTIQYKLNDGAYSTALPQATDAGDYMVWYKVVGDDNHNDVAGTSILVSIAAPTALVLTANPNPDPQHAGDYYSTFYHSAIAYELPVGVEAYTAAISGDMLMMTRIAEGGQVIPANNAVILRAHSGSITLTPSDTEPVTFNVENSLLGTDVEITTPANCYVLSGADGVVGFYQYSGAYLNPHKAYIIYGGANAPRRMRFVFNSEQTATAIDNVSGHGDALQKIIVNGQLIIINNGVRYNAQGQVINHE